MEAPIDAHAFSPINISKVLPLDINIFPYIDM